MNAEIEANIARALRHTPERGDGSGGWVMSVRYLVKELADVRAQLASRDVTPGEGSPPAEARVYHLDPPTAEEMNLLDECAFDETARCAACGADISQLHTCFPKLKAATPASAGAPSLSSSIDTQLACASGRHSYWYPQDGPSRCRWCGHTNVAASSPLPAAQQDDWEPLLIDGWTIRYVLDEAISMVSQAGDTDLANRLGTLHNRIEGKTLWPATKPEQGEDEIAVGQIWSAPDGRQLRVAGLSESEARIAMRNVESNRLTYMDRSNFDASQKWHLTRVPALSASQPTATATPQLERDGNQQCGAKERDGFSYECTLRTGHSGPHIAHGSNGNVLGRWAFSASTATPKGQP